jgi:CheY-like chemotaxis protein
VLVVDDVSANVDLLRTLLTRQGYDVVTACDGERVPKLTGYHVCDKPARSPELAFAELKEEASRGWRRADLVEAFITMVCSPRSSDHRAASGEPWTLDTTPCK